MALFQDNQDEPVPETVSGLTFHLYVMPVFVVLFNFASV